MSDTIIIGRRFCGPPDSGNGGYTCGVVGSRLDGGAEVTLRVPPPLDRPMALERGADGVRATCDGQIVVEARTVALALEAPAPPSFDEATAASARFPWYTGHPFPTCFVCGPRRTPGDGLCIHPGALEGRAIAAAPFVPDRTLVDASDHVRPEIVWASLDCPSWFGFHCFNDFSGGALLGRLAVRIDGRPRAGSRCVVMGWSLGREGRKVRCGSALYSEDGALLAVGQATWIVPK